jgi:hypothetical protein
VLAGVPRAGEALGMRGAGVLHVLAAWTHQRGRRNCTERRSSGRYQPEIDAFDSQRRCPDVLPNSGLNLAGLVLSCFSPGATTAAVLASCSAPVV